VDDPFDGVQIRIVQGRPLGVPADRVHLAGCVPPRPRLAVVGSRAALRSCAARVPGLVAVCRRLGWSVVSGGARGIDQRAHEAALACQVPQLAVLPLGPDRPYPADLRPLFERIAQARDSGVLFARPPGTAPARWMFVERNRWIVALCDAVLVVQADRRSGSVRTGRISLKAKVPTAAMAGTAGCAELVAAGARRIDLDRAARDLEDFLRGKTPRAAPWPAHLAALEGALREGPPRGLAVEDLAGEPAAVCALAEAEALGLVVEVAPGRYRPA